MAEAIKPKTKTKSRIKSSVENDDDDTVNVAEELSIEERLKNLTTFVNTLIEEPEAHKQEPELQAKEEVIDESSVNIIENDGYYKMISENASERIENTFLNLNQRIEQIKEEQKYGDLIGQQQQQQQQHAIEQATAPVFVDDGNSATAPSLDYEVISSDLKKQLIDFNADKIENLQKAYLNYPKFKLLIETEDGELELSSVYDLKLKEFDLNSDYNHEMENNYYTSVIEKSNEIENEFQAQRQQHEFTLYYGRHEFFELLKDFYESRFIVVNCLKHLAYIKDQIYEYATYRVWSFIKYKCEANAYCGDNQRIKHAIDCEKCLLNKESLDRLNGLLKEVRFNIRTVLISSKFCSKLTYLKIEAYLYEFFMLKKQNSDTQDMRKKATSLSDLIDILFHYKRKKFDDGLYNQLLNEWLTKLIKIEMNQTSYDLNFIFYLSQHVFTLQSQHIQYFCKFINLQQFKHLKPDNFSHQFEMFLKFLLLFAFNSNKTRKLFLHQDDTQDGNQASLKASSLTQQQHDNWLFVDLDGDLENLEQIQIDLNEDDLICVYYKIPFYTVYKSIWQLLSECNFDHFLILKCMSFLNYVQKITFQTIIQYNRSKYKNFLKLCANTLNESLKFYKLLINLNSNFYRIYFNKHIKHIYIKFLYSIKLKSMKFTILSLMNIDFGLVTLNTKWFLLCALCGIDVLNENFRLDFDSSSDCEAYVYDSIDYNLEESLKKFNDLELMSFIKILNLMASCDEFVDEKYFKCLCKILFKISYIYANTCDVCHKEGTIILVQLANKHTRLISFVLRLIDENFNKTRRQLSPSTTEQSIENAATNAAANTNNDAHTRYLYLCNQLSFNKWFKHLNNSDFRLMHKWLFEDLNKIKFQILFNCFLTFNFYDANEDEVDDASNDNMQTQMQKLKLLIILYDLHVYLNQTQTHVEPNEAVNKFYTQLTRDNRLKLQTSLWLIIIKLNFNFNLDHLYDRIHLIEQQTNDSDFQITKFYVKHFKATVSASTDSLSLYMNVILTSNLHDFDRFLSADCLSLIEGLLKQKCKLAIYNLFDLFCLNLIHYSQTIQCANEYQRILQEMMNKKRFNTLVQQLFDDHTDVVDYYFTLTYLNLKKHELNRELRELYLGFLFKCFISSQLKWYKCRNLVRFFDNLLSYVFIHDNINGYLLKQLLSCVYNDFSGIFTSVEGGGSDGVSEPAHNLLNTYISWFTNTLTSGGGGGASGSSSSDYLTQFSYDKSLYKDYPYLGLYLSLCEEQIEHDLGLWVTFNLNISTEIQLHFSMAQQTQQKINLDQIWKKTIQQINKDKNLSLSPVALLQTHLMIYKWCERAQSLNTAEPLLIIYWQKFFILYFSMRYLNTQINYFNLNVTLSSYIKQVKLSLEGLNKQFNTKLTNNTQSSEYLKDFYLQLSQIFYAFTLWIDETRLYDLSLDVNALPKHYLNHLLDSLFTKPQDLWFNMINIKEIYENLKKFTKISLNTIKPAKTPLKQSCGNQELFFMRDNIDVDFDLEINLSELLSFEYPLKEQLGVLLTKEKLVSLQMDDVDYMKKLCEHILGQICSYNNELIVNNLNILKSLDDLYIQKYLPNLYRNEICEKYVQIPCKSLINPMHTCTRAALIKFVYEQKEKHVQTKLELKDNRKKYQKVLHLYDADELFPNQQCVKSMLTLNSLIKKLLGNVTLSPVLIDNLLSYIFYLILNTYEKSLAKFNEEFSQDNSQQTQDEDLNSINLYFIDLINLIGHSFVKKSANSKYLLQFILNKISRSTENRLIIIIIEFLTVKSESFIDFYQILLCNFGTFLNSSQIDEQKVDIYLNLFKKFSLEQFKTYTNVDLNKICYKYVELSINFLLNLSSNQNAKQIKEIIEQIFENFISIAILNYPFYLEYILKAIIELSSNKQLQVVFELVGNKHLKIFMNLFKRHELLKIQLNANNLDEATVRSLILFLNKFFTNEVGKYAQLSVKENTFLLHWSHFLAELTQLFEFLIEILMKFQLNLSDLFGCIELLYLKWFYEPIRLEKSSLYYFKLYSEVETTFNSYLKCVNLALTMNGNHKNQIATYLFQFYSKNILLNQNKNDILIDLLNKTFDSYGDSLLLNFNEFIPDVACLSTFLSLINTNDYNILEFFAFQIIANLNLHKIIEYYYGAKAMNHDLINKLLKVLLEILTKFCLNQQIRDSVQFDVKLRPVYQQAESLEWSILSDSTYKEIILDVFAAHGDYNFIFTSRSTKHGLLVNVLKSAAEFYCYTNNEVTSLSLFSTIKRRLFIKAVCEILLKPATIALQKQQNELKETTIMNLLNDVETFSVNAYKEKFLRNEINQLINEILPLITNDFYLSVIQTWICSSKDSPILINFLSCLTSNLIPYKYELIETCLETYFDIERRLSPCLKFEFLIKTGFDDCIGDDWRVILKEIDFSLNFNLLNCLDTSSYLLLNAFLLHNYAIQKANVHTFPANLYNTCVQIVHSLNGSTNMPYSKIAAVKEEKLFLVLIKIFDFLVELLLAFHYNQNDVAILIQQIIQILLYYSDDYVQYPSPNQLQLTQQSATLLTSLLAKKSPYSLKFRFMCRCMAYTLVRQVKLNEVTSKYEVLLESSSPHHQFNDGDTIRLAMLYKHSLMLYNPLVQQKSSSSSYTQFSELAQHVQSVIEAKEFSFLYINNLLKFLFFNLFDDKYYVSS